MSKICEENINDSLINKINNKNEDNNKLILDSHKKIHRKISITKKNNGLDEDNYTNYIVFINLWKFSTPRICLLSFPFIIDTINLIFAGKYFSSEHLSAIGLGTFYVNFSGLVFAIGILEAIYNKYSHKFRVNSNDVIQVILNTTKICIITLSFLIIIPSTFLCEKVLSYLGQDPRVVVLSSQFVKSLNLHIIFYPQYLANVAYLQLMDLYLPVIFINSITIIFHPIWCFLMLKFTNQEINSIGFATGFTSILNFSISTIYIKYKFPFSITNISTLLQSFEIKRILDYLNHTIPTAILYTFDKFGIDLIVLFTGYLGTNSLAASVILFTYISLISSIPIGVGKATTNMIANSVNFSQNRSANLYAILSCLSSCILIFIIGCITQFTKYLIPFIYTNDDRVIEITSYFLAQYILFGLFDSFQLILNSIIKGLGKEYSATILRMVIMFPVNITLSINLAFVMNYQIEGLWVSLFTSVVLLTFSYMTIILCVDWNNLINRTIVRIEVDDK